jgi:hypothetical protein
MRHHFTLEDMSSWRDTIQSIQNITWNIGASASYLQILAIQEADIRWITFLSQPG